MNMKKYALILLMALVGLSMTGCISVDTDCKYHAKPIYLEVQSKDWKFDTQNEQFYIRFDVPEITTKVFNDGNYSLHREYNTGTNDVYQVGLPQTLFLWENVTSGNTTQTIYYQQLVDYRVGVGYVEFQVTNSDFYYPSDTHNNLIKPESMVFHLQLIY